MLRNSTWTVPKPIRLAAPKSPLLCYRTPLSV